MAKKVSSAIADIKNPGHSVPSSTSRPIVVTDRSLLTADPMVVDSPEAPDATEPVVEETTVSRQALPVIPPAEEESAPSDEAEPAVPLKETNEPAPAGAAPVSQMDSPADDATSADIKRAAAEEKQLAADVAHQAELEKLVAKGTYFVPINAVQRKRSRLVVMALTVVAVVLALIVLDIALDAHLLSLPLPHTHFFLS